MTALAGALNLCANRITSLFSRSSRRLSSSYTISEENPTLYRPGGYHPVRIGDAFNSGKYKVVNKLGYGAYSTVWLTQNVETQQHVALKVLAADSYGHQKDTYELAILRSMNAKQTQTPDASHILALLDEFEHRGPNGNHICLVFKAMGPDMSKYRRVFPRLRIPIPMMKEISRQLLLALSYLHDTCRVIHTDIKPQNILIETPAINKMFQQAPSEAFEPEGSTMPPPKDFYMPSTYLTSREEDLAQATDISVRLSDFGTSSWFNDHLTEWIQPQMLRAPEVILGADWDRKVDIWNLGLVIWELAEGQLLFDGTWTAKSSYCAEAHLAQMNAILGDIPKTLLSRSKNRDQYFDVDGTLLEPPTFPPCSLEQFSKNPANSESEKRNFLSFISSMIKLNPEDRPDATVLLESEWLTST